LEFEFGHVPILFEWPTPTLLIDERSECAASRGCTGAAAAETVRAIVLTIRRIVRECAAKSKNDAEE
jgi:hypothetical protein